MVACAIAAGFEDDDDCIGSGTAIEELPRAENDALAGGKDDLVKNSCGAGFGGSDVELARCGAAGMNAVSK